MFSLGISKLQPLYIYEIDRIREKPFIVELYDLSKYIFRYADFNIYINPQTKQICNNYSWSLDIFLFFLHLNDRAFWQTILHDDEW